MRLSPIEEWRIFVGKNRLTDRGQRTPEGNQRGERPLASYPGRRGQRPIVSAGSAEMAIAHVLGGWRSPEAPRRQQRKGYSDRTSERSRDLVGARVDCEAKRDEKVGLRRPCKF